MHYIFAILFLLDFVSARADDKVAVPNFSNYPETESFRYYLSVHTNSVWNLQHTNLVVISAFPTGGGFALQYSVKESGQESDRRNVYDWAIQASHWKRLSEADIKRLHSALQNLPAKSKTPSIERLVIISFREGTNWMTRSYDSGTLSKPMR